MENRRFFRAAVLWISLLALAFAGCAPQAQTAVPADPTPQPLTGQVTWAEVQSADGWKELTAADYTPDAALVETIRENAGDVKVLLFLGTWCGDSKREVPRFFKLIEQAGISESQVEITALDRTKKDAAGLTEKWGVEYVPTFIFIRGGEEIGRIVEMPAESLEADIAKILLEG
ncbi:MAG: thioredoxin family protein [Chloroflexi bacterium]|nr:thioredoxin family protein [Chloroflexota bacterium]